jgi:hypothetical protein
VPDLDPNRKRIAKLLRMLGSTGNERRNAFVALEHTMRSEGVNWTDIGNAYELSAGGKYTEEEMQEIFTAGRKEGVEAGIQIGLAQQGNGNGHLSLPTPQEMAEHCRQQLSQLTNANERAFVSETCPFIQRRVRAKLTLGQLGFLASIYIKTGGRT